MNSPKYRLVMRTGPNPGKAIDLDKVELFLGRELSNDIVINDSEISRRHARLVLQPGGVILEDLGSTNGTSVNGQRLTGPVLLQGGESITLGENVNLYLEMMLTDPDATVVSTVQPVAPVQPQVVVPPAAPAPVAPAPVQPAPQPWSMPVQAQTPPPPAYIPPAAPVYPTPPPPAFAGQVPVNPVSQPVSKKKNKKVWIIVAIVALAVICLCGGFFWFIDYNSLWCIFPFIPGCP
jgi:pSer/pThr/pTyr-binding forkhead associated (FHA) protein